MNDSTPGYEGIVVGLWAPAAASTPLGEIEIETEYPFVLGYSLYLGGREGVLCSDRFKHKSSNTHAHTRASLG